MNKSRPPPWTSVIHPFQITILIWKWFIVQPFNEANLQPSAAGWQGGQTKVVEIWTIQLMQKISLSLSLFVSLNAYTAVAGHSGPGPCPVEEPTVNHCAVIGGCGSRGIVGHPLIMQFKPCPQVIVGRSTACLAAPPPSVCVRVCVCASGVRSVFTLSNSHSSTKYEQMVPGCRRCSAGWALWKHLQHISCQTGRKRCSVSSASRTFTFNVIFLALFWLGFFFLYSINPHPVHKQPEQWRKIRFLEHRRGKKKKKLFHCVFFPSL